MKTKVLISFAITAQLINVFVFACDKADFLMIYNLVFLIHITYIL